MSNPQSIGLYLLDRLADAGVTHVFGVPGDYVLGFYDLLVHSRLQHVGTTREDTAAFAADGYARCRGIGALAVTYGVGALNVVNAVAGAYAESSPVVVISGAPGVNEQQNDPQIHHRFGPFRFQREIFERITCATAVLDDPVIAFRQIDRALAMAKRHSKPVYIEIPRDIVHLPGQRLQAISDEEPKSDPAAVAEAVSETLALLANAERPALLAGVELHRRNLQDAVIELVERANLPLAATLTGKSVVGERHRNYLGVYEGAMGSQLARDLVENADLLLALGVHFNDVDLGGYTASLDPTYMVHATHEEVIIRRHHYPKVLLGDFLAALTEKAVASKVVLPVAPQGPSAADFPRPAQKMTVARLMGRINDGLTAGMTLVCDVGDCLFASIDLRVHQRSDFLACAYYTSMGFATPAALGAHVARPDHRPIIMVGDGAFQMTGTELSTIARLGLNPIVIVFNNAGYSTERYILEGPFNDIATWRFDRLGELFGPLQGFDVHTEEQFETAFQTAMKTADRPSVLNVHLRADDPSPAMRRLAEHLKHRLDNRKS
jgi:indolepyruvate decarboxylase